MYGECEYSDLLSDISEISSIENFKSTEFNCTEPNCFTKFNCKANLQQHRKNKHGIKLRSKMSNKVFSPICESIMKAHASMVKQNITDYQLMNILKDQYSENTVADVKRELSTFKSKWIKTIDWTRGSSPILDNTCVTLSNLGSSSSSRSFFSADKRSINIWSTSESSNFILFTQNITLFIF